MRVTVTMSIIAASVACGCSEPLVPADQVAIEGVYTVSRCNFGPPSPPCATYLSGISQHILDSARLVLNRDGTATWMAATFSQLCEVGKPCQSSEAIVERSGTYRILPMRLQVLLNTDLAESIIEFATHIPANVPRTWSGPDTLRFGADGGTSHSVTFGKIQ